MGGERDLPELQTESWAVLEKLESELRWGINTTFTEVMLSDNRGLVSSQGMSGEEKLDNLIT